MIMVMIIFVSVSRYIYYKKKKSYIVLEETIFFSGLVINMLGEFRLPTITYIS